MIYFAIVGTFKSATSTLAWELRKHAKIDIPTIKDPYFFLASLAGRYTGPEEFLRAHNERAVTDPEVFESLYGNTTGALRGDATPLYLYCHEHAIPNIKGNSPDARIVIVLRNPIDRAFSNYLHNRKDGYELRSFAECIATWKDTEHLPLHPFFHYVRAGFYNAQVTAYIRAFENVKIVNYDDILTQPHIVLNQICAFLGIEQNYERKEVIRLNKTGQPRLQFLHDFIRQESILKAVLRPVYRTLFYSPDRRISISEKVKNMNIKSIRIDKSNRSKLADIYRSDIDALSKKTGCEFVKNWNL